MACYHPLEAWVRAEPKGNGKKSLYFGKKQAFSDQEVKLNCGQCIGCRLDRSRSWALRCHHEAQQHEENSFITLTYAEEPEAGSLTHRDFQLFLKRLRKAIHPNKVRYYMCGEYGNVYDENGVKKPGLLGRPHFHCILFGWSFPDRLFFKNSNTGYPIYTSEVLDMAWKLGYATTQNFSLETAAYVARYVTKKISGDQAPDHYQRVNYETGEITQVKSEYTTMSRRPGIGKEWIEQYHGDLYPKDFVTAAGVRFRPPRYYDDVFESINAEAFKLIKEKRSEAARQPDPDKSTERLRTREKVQLIKAEKLERNL